ncbi:carbohydrate porin [Hahella sp. SMD15-11]|uniref:Carbohydrate porin n=1 Tax=Thermohahella caldifontis TaxID=3142973 RepID=A0AB39UVI1_9GAMM
MKKTTLSARVALAVTALASSFAQADMGLSANIELDTDIAKASGQQTAYDQGGRIEVNVTGEKQVGDFTVSGKGSALIKKDGSAASDDMWVKFAGSNWSLQAGRFEAINLFPLGKDTVVSHAGDGSAQVYEANLVRGRAGDNGGQFAVRYQPAESISLELDTLWGDADASGNNTDAFSGIRPSVTFSNGDLTLTAGAERMKYDLTGGGSVDKQGAALTGALNLNGAAINLNATHLKDKVTDTKVMTLGANVTMGSMGLGIIHATTDTGSGANPKVLTAYGAYTIAFADIPDASVTLALSSSKATDAGPEDRRTVFRTRINYTF